MCFDSCDTRSSFRSLEPLPSRGNCSLSWPTCCVDSMRWSNISLPSSSTCFMCRSFARFVISRSRTRCRKFKILANNIVEVLVLLSCCELVLSSVVTPPKNSSKIFSQLALFLGVSLPPSLPRYEAYACLMLIVPPSTAEISVVISLFCPFLREATVRENDKSVGPAAKITPA